jgi:hypothetical protein
MPLTVKKKTSKPKSAQVKKSPASQPKKVSATKPTQSNQEKAYQLVTNDLLKALQQAQPGEKIPFGSLGFFKKGLCEVNPGDGYVYTCHKLSFKMSKQLKEVLNG